MLNVELFYVIFQAFLLVFCLDDVPASATGEIEIHNLKYEKQYSIRLWEIFNKFVGNEKKENLLTMSELYLILTGRDLVVTFRVVVVEISVWD